MSLSGNIFFISTYIFKFFHLNYIVKYSMIMKKIISKVNYIKYINFYIKYQKCSPFKYILEEINKDSIVPVIIHIYH